MFIAYCREVAGTFQNVHRSLYPFPENTFRAAQALNATSVPRQYGARTHSRIAFLRRQLIFEARSGNGIKQFFKTFTVICATIIGFPNMYLDRYS